MRAKHPREVVDRWVKTGKEVAEYVGEWHLFVWPARTKDIPAYFVGYRIEGDTTYYTCDCRGSLFSTKDDKANGTECYHIRSLRRQLKEAM